MKTHDPPLQTAYLKVSVWRRSDDPRDGYAAQAVISTSPDFSDWDLGERLQSPTPEHAAGRALSAAFRVKSDRTRKAAKK